MLNGSTDLLIGCRLIVQLRTEANVATTSAFDTLRGVESETDGYPLGERRAAFSQELLARLDLEVSGYLAEVRPALLDACKEIIREVETWQLHSGDELLQ